MSTKTRNEPELLNRAGTPYVSRVAVLSVALGVTASLAAAPRVEDSELRSNVAKPVANYCSGEACLVDTAVV